MKMELQFHGITTSHRLHSVEKHVAFCKSRASYCSGYDNRFVRKVTRGVREAASSVTVALLIPHWNLHFVN